DQAVHLLRRRVLRTAGNFDSDLPLQLEIFGHINGAECAAAQHAAEQIAIERCSFMQLYFFVRLELGKYFIDDGSILRELLPVTRGVCHIPVTMTISQFDA